MLGAACLAVGWAGKDPTFLRRELVQWHLVNFVKKRLKICFASFTFASFSFQLLVGFVLLFLKSFSRSLPDLALFFLLILDIASRFLNTLLNSRTPEAREAPVHHQSPRWGAGTRQEVWPDPCDHPGAKQGIMTFIAPHALRGCPDDGWESSV